MKPCPFVLSALAVACLGACSAGNGVGAASGAIYAYGCSKNGDYCPNGTCGTSDAPAPYNLNPAFFAGEPIDDLREYGLGSDSEVMRNRLIIRLQTSGKQIERNDVLTFDVVSSYEVARCVRGRVELDPVLNTRKNDWNERDCFRDSSDSGPGRMRLQYDSSVRAFLNPKSTCTANLVADAISAPVPTSYDQTPTPIVTDGSWDSWVEFQEFGSASQASLPATERSPVDRKFRIELGDRIYATNFRLTLVDDGVVNAAISAVPQLDSLIGGTLGGDPSTGRFDFDLARGQGAQFFP